MGKKKREVTGERKDVKRILKVKAELSGNAEGFLSEILGDVPPEVSTRGKGVEPSEEVSKEGGEATVSAVTAQVLFAPSPEGEVEVERVLDQYSMTQIVKIRGGALPLYRVKMPELTDEEKEILTKCKKRAVEEIKIDPQSIPDPAERRRIFMQELVKIVERETRGMRLPQGRIKELSDAAFHDMIGYGPLDSLIADDKLEDILVIGVNKPVYVYHSKYGMCVTNISFKNEDTIRYFIDKMARLVGRRIDHQMPLLDARLPDGSRINATISPVSLDGPTLSIRKFRKDPLTIIDLLNLNTLSTDIAAFLWLIVHGLDVKPANILFSGGTGSGKTTMLNSATTFVPAYERIISIEDTAELQLPHQHWIRLETRPPNIEGKGEITMDDLVKNALRMRPDRIVVGEVRGSEARTMFTAMNTGHDGAVGGETSVLLAGGEWEPMGDLCEKFFDGCAETYPNGMEYVRVPPKYLFNVISFDEKLNPHANPVQRVWRRKIGPGERLLKIRVRSGKEITLTEDHPVFILAGNDVRRKEAGRVTPGDRIMTTAPTLPVPGVREIDARKFESTSPRLLASPGVGWEEVTGIEREESSGYVYDLTVERNHNYVANGFVVSNCMGTLHANSAVETIARLTEAPMSVPPIMIPALDVIVMLQRIYHRQKGHIRRITEIAEVTGLEGGKPQLSRIFKWNPRTDTVEPTGVPIKLKHSLSELSGRSGTEIEIELKRRAAVLEWMKRKGVRNVFDVGAVIQEYYQNPDKVLKRVKEEVRLKTR